MGGDGAAAAGKTARSPGRSGGPTNLYVTFFSTAVLESPDFANHHNLYFLVNLYDRPNFKKKRRSIGGREVIHQIADVSPTGTKNEKIWHSSSSLVVVNEHPHKI